MAVAIGQITIVDVTDGATTVAQYVSNTSLTTAPSAGWSSSIPSPSSGYYIWKRERIEYADGTYDDWQDPIRITGAIGDTGSTGPQGDQGPQGETGPAGTPGYLGLIVSGSTLTLKGYDSDGILQASVGYIYVNGQRHAVAEHTETFDNGVGQGYILFDTSSGTVQFVKMQPNQTVISYYDYESGTLTGSSGYIIGKFYRDQAIYNAEILPAQSTAMYQQSHFMEILSGDDASAIETWAQALGATQVFERIAVLEAFVNKLVANQIRVGGGNENSGFLFKAEVVSEQAVIAAYYEGERVFYIDGNTGAIEIRGTGKFLGLIDSDPLTTQKGETGDSITSALSKSIWSTDELYSDLTTIPEGEVIQNASGSYIGKTITGLTRFSSSESQAIVSHYFDSGFLYSVKGSSSNPHITFLAYEEIPSGISKIRVSVTARNVGGSGDDAPFVAFYKNGANPVIGYEYVVDNIDQGLSFGEVFVLNNYDFETLSIDLPVSPGLKVGIAIKSNSGDKKGEASSVWIDFFSDLTGKGVFIQYSDGSSSIIGKDQRRNDTLSLNYPSWASDSNLNYYSGTDFYDKFSSLTLGISTPCSGSLTVDGGGYENLTVNPLYVTRNSNSISFQLSSGFVVIDKWGGQGSTVGVYSTLSCSITIVGQLSAVKFNNLLPKTASAAIGQGSNRVNAFFGENADINTINSNIIINTENSSNKIWGAVAN